MRRIVLVLFCVIIASCKGPKIAISSETAQPGMAAKSIIKAHRAATPDFDTISSRVKVAYEDAKQRQNVSVSLRMKKDQTIWLKASVLGITLAKAMITPQKVMYYETLSNTYFDGDFELLSNWLGTELDFEKTQALLLGQSIFAFPNGAYRASVADNKYKLVPNSQPDNFMHDLFLNPAHFKVDKGSIAQPYEDRELLFSYGPYQELEGGFYPTVFEISARQGAGSTKIGVEYRKIDVNAAVSFPFEIPSGYEKIELSK